MAGCGSSSCGGCGEQLTFDVDFNGQRLDKTPAGPVEFSGTFQEFIEDLARIEGVEAPKRPAFNEAADRTLTRAQSIHNQRGNEYQDSWALENVHAPFINHVLSEVFGLAGANAEELRLLLVAALVDVKDSRMGGAFKLDTIDDGINYRAAFASWMDDYQTGGKNAD